MNRHQPFEPDFDDRFWATVAQRVDRVRDLTKEELLQAEAELLTVQQPAEVVPVFPAPFWARVNRRAAKVRRMALDELADAEDALLRQGNAEGLRPAAVPAYRRFVPELPRMAMPLRARFNSLGFVTAVLAVLFLLPQVMPISSFADVRERGPLSFIFSDGARQGGPAPELAAEESGGTSQASSNQKGKSGSGNPLNSGGSGSTSKATSSSSSPEKTGTSGTPGTAAGTSGGTGGSGTPAAAGGGNAGAAAGPSSESAGDGAEGFSTEDGASAASVPSAPSNLLVTAVDNGTVRLRWKDNSNDESGFVLERRGQTAVGRERVGANTKSYLWTGLLAGTEYCFRVRAENSAGASGWFPEQYRCVTTHATPSTAVPVALSPMSCAGEGGLSAGSAVQETRITFRNLTASPVRIYSLGRNGVREPSPVTVGPQGSTSVETFLGHPFVVTSADESASCIAIFTGESWSSVATIS